MTRTVAVIGAGIVGVSAALWLQRDGHCVVLVDRAGPGEGASFGNGGVLASCAIVPVTGPALPRGIPKMLLHRDSPLFVNWRHLPRAAPWLLKYLSVCSEENTRRIAAALLPVIGDSLEQHLALARGTAAERWLHSSDYLYAYQSRAAFEAERFSWALRRQSGFTWDEIGPDRLREDEPLLDLSFRFGIRLGNHGYISDPGGYVRALAAEAERNGARLLKAEVTSIVVDNGRATGIRAGGETIPADAVILAAGAWSTALARSLNIEVPMESERGYHLEFLEPSEMPRGPIMVSAGKFVVTPMEGRIRIAGLLEFGGLEAPPNSKAFAHLQRLAKAAMPRLKWRETRQWMGHRPSPADSIPLIGEVPGAAGAYVAFGHHHVGLTGGPRTGRIVADLIAGRGSNIDLAPYRPDRFYKARE
ncbi:MAG: FAD-binding oxidoreductase [Rhizobiales bacterium]|nr:FAD-binding oxidoreductase [Hyphomicrobiales bacterium]